MCGIVGCRSENSTSVDETQLRQRLRRIKHRGPDDEGEVKGRSGWLGHRRLSIIDVSGGKQPISNEAGTIFPGIAILVLTLSVNFLGQGLRDALAPQLGEE